MLWICTSGDFGQALRDVVNVRNMLDAWKYIDTTVVAYVPDHDGGVQSLAVLRLRYKDWLGAWLQIYLDVDADASPLQNEFDNVKQRGGSAETLLDMMHTRVRDFLKNQQGLIDTYASRQVAARGPSVLSSTPGLRTSPQKHGINSSGARICLHDYCCGRQACS